MLGFGTGEDPREDSDNKTTPGGRGLGRNSKIIKKNLHRIIIVRNIAK